MKKSLLLVTTILLISVIVFGCCSVKRTAPGTSVNDSASTEESDINTSQDSFTLLVYLCGSDLESRFGEASANIAEMQAAEFSPNINVIVQTGGSQYWKDIEISAQSTDRFLIKDGDKQLIDRNTVKQNFGESQTLADFIKFGVEQYPADQYGLILWNHGSGSIKGVCFDANFENDGLTLPEIKDALASTQDVLGKKFEFIGLDACLMATYDMASILKSYANYMIASEELEPLSGWDYTTLISSLGKESFYTDVLDSYADKQSAKATYTLSVINLSEMEKADAVVEEIARQIDYNLSYVGKALSEGKEFGAKGESRSGTNLFDLGLIADSLGIDYDFSSFITKVNGAAHESAMGMSLYFPTEQADLLTEYKEICQNSLYMDFLIDYLYFKPESTIVFDNMGYDDNGCMSFILSDFSEQYVQSVGYELHSFAGSEETQKLYCVGTDNDVSFAEGIYTVNFQGNWVFMNDVMLHTDVYEEKDTHTIFSAPVKINGELCNFLFTYFKPTQSIQVEGYVLESDLSSRVHDISDGMKLTILYEDPFSEDGQLYYEEGTITWSEDIDLSIKKLKPGYYQYIPYVVDIYGNVYCGNTAVVYFDGEKSTMDSIRAG
ncbi:MAG TPA: hypothetical protein GX728_01135 [Clostridiaceae bacterium]|nr:hypothetical protein [Clostridiaceae bacterium]